MAEIYPCDENRDPVDSLPKQRKAVNIDGAISQKLFGHGNATQLMSIEVPWVPKKGGLAMSSGLNQADLNPEGTADFYWTSGLQDCAGIAMIGSTAGDQPSWRMSFGHYSGWNSAAFNERGSVADTMKRFFFNEYQRMLIMVSQGQTVSGDVRESLQANLHVAATNIHKMEIDNNGTVTFIPRLATLVHGGPTKALEYIRNNTANDLLTIAEANMARIQWVDNEHQDMCSEMKSVKAERAKKSFSFSDITGARRRAKLDALDSLHSAYLNGDLDKIDTIIGELENLKGAYIATFARRARLLASVRLEFARATALSRANLQAQVPFLYPGIFL